MKFSIVSLSDVKKHATASIYSNDVGTYGSSSAFPCFHPFQAFVRSRAFSSPPSFCLEVNVWTETYEQPLIHSTIRRSYIHSFIHSFNTFVPHEDTGRLSRRYAPGNLLTVLYNVITSIPSLLFLPSESGLGFIKFHGSTPYNRKFLDNLIYPTTS